MTAGITSALDEAAPVMRTSWFDALIKRVESLPGPPWAFVVAAAVLVGLIMHLADFVDGPERFRIRADLVVGAASPPIFLWLALTLDRVARKALARLSPALDPTGESEAVIEADLTRTPNRLAWPALLIGALGGVASVLQAPENWGIDTADPGLAYPAALGLAVLTEVLLLGLVSHIVHQLRVVTRVHRTVQIDLFHLEPLYAFSILTASTGLALLALIVGLIVSLSLAIGTFLLVGSSDVAITGVIGALALACFFVPLIGLHGRIADEKAARMTDAQTTLATVLAAVRTRVAEGDLEGASKLKDAMLAADASVVAIARISTWPWRTETLRGFVSAVLLPIGLFLVYELLRRLLSA